MINKDVKEGENPVEVRVARREDQVDQEEDTRDTGVETGALIEERPEVKARIYEGGYLADLYREIEKRKEEGEEGHAPGWDTQIGYYKNR